MGFINLYFVTICFEVIATSEWTEFDGRLYKTIRDTDGNIKEYTWDGAVQRCSQEGAILITPTADMNIWFTQYIEQNTADSPWIGLNDKLINGDWRWPDGSQLQTKCANWDLGEPNNKGSEECVHAYSSGKWNDKSCGATRSVICQKCKPVCGSSDSNGTCISYIETNNLECNGSSKPWQDCNPDCQPWPTDIIFVVDTSESTSLSIRNAVTYIQDIVSYLPVGANEFQIAVISYDFEPHVLFRFNEHLSVSSVQNAAGSLTGNGGATFTAKALRKADEVFSASDSGARSYAQKYVILLHDGLSSDTLDTYKMADQLRDKNIILMAVAFGQSVLHEELFRIADNNEYVHGFLHLQDTAYALIKNSKHDVCSGCVFHSETDVIILIDNNKNQSADGFLSRRVSLRKIIETLQCNENTNTALLTVSDHSHYVFQFSALLADNVHHLIAAALNIKTDLSMTSNVSHALNMVKRNGFLESNGGRPSSRKIVLLLSDGLWEDVKDVKEEIKSMHEIGIYVMGISAGSDVSLQNYYDCLVDPSQLLYIPHRTRSNEYKCLEALTSIMSFYDCS